MEEKELEELFRAKIGLEMARFKQRMLKKNPDFIYGEACRIVQMDNIYNQLLEIGKRMESDALKMMLMFPDILTYLYCRSLKREDSCYREMGECLTESILQLIEEYKNAKEEGGTKAA